MPHPSPPELGGERRADEVAPRRVEPAREAFAVGDPHHCRECVEALINRFRKIRRLIVVALFAERQRPRSVGPGGDADIDDAPAPLFPRQHPACHRRIQCRPHPSQEERQLAPWTLRRERCRVGHPSRCWLRTGRSRRVLAPCASSNDSPPCSTNLAKLPEPGSCGTLEPGALGRRRGRKRPQRAGS